MILIIEGPDLSGKTTIISKLGKTIKDGFVIKNLYKPSYPKDKKIWNQYLKILNFHLENPDILIILDRFYPSQEIYSYLRGEDEFRCKDALDIENLIICKHDHLCIYLNTTKNDLYRRYRVRGDEHIKGSDIDKIKNRYDNFYESTKLNKIRLNSKWKNSIERIIAKLK